MSFIIQANPAKDGAPTETIADRIEALRHALILRKTGYRNVQVIGDGRLYTLREFAGTITIGEKVVVSQ